MNYVVRAFKPSEEQYVADLHERLYSGEYAWGPGFIDYARKIALEFPKRRSPDTDELWVATDERDRPVGSIMLCATDDPKVGQLRLFAVEEICRRQGIGGKLMGHCLKKRALSASSGSCSGRRRRLRTRSVSMSASVFVWWKRPKTRPGARTEIPAAFDISFICK